MSLSRRDFLALGAAAGAGAALAAAGCAGPVREQPSEEFLRLPLSDEPGRVALALTATRDLRAVAEAALARVTDFAWLGHGDSVFVKVSCNSPNAHPAVTAPEAVTAIVGLLQDRGAGKVYVGDQAGVEHVRLTHGGRVRSTRELMARNGLLAAIEKSGAIFHAFDDQAWASSFQPEADFAHGWEKALWLPAILREVQHVVNLPRVGSHAIAGYTCGAKIAVGWLRDDGRAYLHRRGDRFYENMAEISHFRPLRDKLRCTLTLATRALLDIGPDFGGDLDLEGTLALASTRLVDHDAVATALLPWLDRQSRSFFDVYEPYPRHADFWNRRLVKETWGGEALADYRRLRPPAWRRGLAHDACLARLATLARYRPRRIEVRALTELPEDLVEHLRAAHDGLLWV